MNDSSRLVIVLTTEGDVFKAKYLAKSLLEERLAACISIKEVDSLYYWKGELNNSSEAQLLIKTTKEKLNKLIEVIKTLHSYELPELIYWFASATNSYVEWVESLGC